MPWFQSRQREALVHALIITYAAHAIPFWFGQQIRLSDWFSTLEREPGYVEWLSRNGLGFYWAHEEIWALLCDMICLAFGLILVAPNPKKYGLRIGAIRANWRRVLIVIGTPTLVAAAVAPFLTLPKFSISLWLISPLAQDLVFSGYLYSHLDDAFPGPVHRRVPVDRAVLLAACFFSLWHTPNFVYWPWTFVVLQLGYTFLGAAIVGMTRQWTGSFIYITMAHMIGTFGAWYLSQSPYFPLRF